MTRRQNRWLACTLLLLVASGTRGDEPDDALGRLFFTPAQRALLDRERHMPVTTASDMPQTIRGRLVSSRGRTFVWIDGEAREQQDVAARLSSLQAGQTLDPAAGDIRDLIDGRITVSSSRHRNAR